MPVSSHALHLWIRLGLANASLGEPGGLPVPQLRAEADDLVIGLVFTVLGTGILLLAAIRGRRQLTLVCFASFVSLYGLRLLAGTQYARLVFDLSDDHGRWLTAFISYVINVPAWGFYLAFFGPGWRSSIRWMVHLFALFAAGAIVSDLVQGRPGTAIPMPNNLLVLAAVGVVTLNLVLRTWPLDRDSGVLLAGFGVLGLSAINENLVGLGMVPWSWRDEKIGFVAFVACLGYVVARGVVAGERQLIALSSEMRMAREVQQSLLPEAPPTWEGVVVAARHRPTADVAGDVYEFQTLDDGRVGVLIADVAGHGVPAALVASMVKVASSCAVSPADTGGTAPSRILAAMNRILCGHLRRRTFVTAVLAYLDPRSGALEVASGGHPYPLLWRSGERQVVEVVGGGPLLGRFPTAAFDDGRDVLAPGDRLILYTDGVVEQRNAGGEMFGEARLRSAVESVATRDAAAACDGILARITGWAANGHLDDDVTLVVLDFVPP